LKLNNTPRNFTTHFALDFLPDGLLRKGLMKRKKACMGVLMNLTAIINNGASAKNKYSYKIGASFYISPESLY
jgi:hypothetical protein